MSALIGRATVVSSWSLARPRTIELR